MRAVERHVRRALDRDATRFKIESISYLISLDTEISPKQLNSEKLLLNFRNGLLDLRSLELLPHSPECYSTIQLPFDYQPGATCPRWTKFLEEIFAGDQERAMLLQEMFGYILVPDTSHQKMFWLVGEGANGKGVAIKILESLVDKTNRTSLDVRNISSPFVRAAMYGKLLSVNGDFPRKFFGNEDLVKLIVGGDTVDAQEKFKQQFEFTPTCRFIFAMNSLPSTNDKSHGFFRRVIIVPFDRVFTEQEQDRGLVKRLCDELPGIFVWALNGLKRLVQQREFTTSSRANKVLAAYRQENDSVGLFVGDACVVHPDAKDQASVLWQEYETYCADSGISELSRKEFAKQLRANHPVTVKTHRWGSEARPERTYFGIGIRESDPQ